MCTRKKYDDIRSSFLFFGYAYCKHKFMNGRIYPWVKTETEWGGALEDLELSYELTIQNLMLYVVATILFAGRNAETHNYFLGKIREILQSNKIDDLISILDADEKEDFLNDLNDVLNCSKEEN